MNEMFVSFFSSGMWAVIKAVLLLLLAFITAAVVKSLVVKLFAKTKLNALLKQTDSVSQYTGCIGHPYHWLHWSSLSLAAWLQSFPGILWKA